MKVLFYWASLMFLMWLTPWWTFIVLAFVFGWLTGLDRMRNTQSLVGLFGLFLLYFFAAWISDQNEGLVISQTMRGLLPAPRYIYYALTGTLVTVPSIFAVLSGQLLRAYRNG